MHDCLVVVNAGGIRQQSSFIFQRMDRARRKPGPSDTSRRPGTPQSNPHYFAAADKVDQLYTTHLTTSPA
jgi:hypothetical protein